MRNSEAQQALNTINQALEIAQRKGAFSLKDSATIAVALDTLNRFHAPIGDGAETAEGVKEKIKAEEEKK